tara:strand:+ start:105 stop:788 length:684 start_codon:yes stop_codon:yes gene_type:complete
MNFDVIIQCRFYSTRLPGKILLPLNKNLTSLDILIQNLKLIKKINRIILTVPKDDANKVFDKMAKKYNINCHAPKCKSQNVLKRFYLTSKKFNSQHIIRITSDCPFINIYTIKKMIKYYIENRLNFLTNNKPRYVPHGFDCEIFSGDLLKKTFQKAKSLYDLEHVTPWIYKKNFKKINNIRLIKKNYSNLRITLDTISDYNFFIENFKILKKISKSKNFVSLLKKLP